MKLECQKVLITGGSSGIGFALAQQLAARDCRVVICGRNQDRLAEARTRLPGVATVVCDSGVEADLRSLVDEVRQRLGGLNLLINNAAVQYACDLITVDRDAVLAHVAEEVAIDLLGPIRLSVLALPLLSAEREAAIVNVSSVLALAPKRAAPVYCAAKAGLRVFSKALRYQVESAGLPISVVSIILPAVDTEMSRGRGGVKLSPARAASAILRAVERDTPEAYVGLAGLIGVLMRIMPSVPERMMRDVSAPTAVYTTV